LADVATLSEADIRSLVGPAEALEAMRRAFAALHRGEVTQPANMDFEFPDAEGEAHLKGAHIHGSPHWAVKAATGFWSNESRGLPVTSGLFLVFSAETGLLSAVLLDNGYLTELRTGAAGALAADLLARDEVEQAAIIGAGGQARYQLEALLGVRRPERIVVASRSGADTYARTSPRSGSSRSRCSHAPTSSRPTIRRSPHGTASCTMRSKRACCRSRMSSRSARS
jgi:ornithine cyclodeaminase